MPAFSDLPVELLIDNLLPLAGVHDVLRLGCTNKFFSLVCADDTFWKRKCQTDFNFTSAETARTSGWKKLYRGLSHPRVYVWGERRNGRLGVKELPKNIGWGVPYPMEVKFPGARIVSLIAGGMSFHALDSKGNMFVWGTLDGQNMALNSEGFAMKYKEASVPHKLIMPDPIRSVSCGRIHAMALDSQSQVWTFVSWGRPFKFQSPLLDCHAADTTPVQVECGWAFSSILTASGDVLVYWPFAGEIDTRVQTENTIMNQRSDSQAHATSDNSIPCVAWTLRSDPFRLPHLPQLPKLDGTGADEGPDDFMEVKLIKIASFDNQLIGLTNKGHVLKFRDLSNEASLRHGQWEYLPTFSEVSRVREQPAFAAGGSKLDAPTTMQITHISAHFETFVAYSTGSSSIILMGDTDTDASSAPKILPGLQHRAIISVVLGDYHFGALTASGQLLTWGSYSHGALGLGRPLSLPAGAPGGYATEQELTTARSRFSLPDPPDVDTPAEVRFDHEKKGGRKFVFGAAAAGWHTGALVIDLEPEKEEEPVVEEPVRPLPGQYPSTPGPSLGPLPVDPGGLLPPGGGFGIFRIGHAGRGIFPRGRGLGPPRGRGGN
ncbi:RCC1/BLIP-II [Artomyces pyxidatus]|uniref:RCC1/BLIP-II n=1 Tax=Artomyces pyxidatus TaxID=48021 RepID=A0ACB8T7A4_9AGAM|nr:RCC1/BLIP-II [Artomyces pyxidatus]